MKIEESRNEKVIIDRKRLEQLEEFENNIEKILIKKSNVYSWTRQIENVEYLGKDEVVLILENKLNEANKSIIELNERIKNINYRKELIKSEFEKTTLKERISFLNENTLKDWFIDKLEKYVYSLL
jgi:hypothetical protein